MRAMFTNLLRRLRDNKRRCRDDGKSAYSLRFWRSVPFVGLSIVFSIMVHYGVCSWVAYDQQIMDYYISHGRPRVESEFLVSFFFFRHPIMVAAIPACHIGAVCLGSFGNLLLPIFLRLFGLILMRFPIAMDIREYLVWF